MGEQHDAGMRAVARVRGVREQDSRLGLGRAFDDEREAVRRHAAVCEQLAATPVPEGSLAGFLAGRAAGQRLATETSLARDGVEAARTVTTAAREHWRRDHTRLAAVELLLERRAEVRRAERARREAAEIDDLVAARWLRARRGGAPR